MKKVLSLSLLLCLSGCYSVSGNKVLTLDPSDKPVVVTAQAKTTCYDFLLFTTCRMNMSLESSDGKKVSDFKK